MNCGNHTASSCSHCVYDGSGKHADASWCSSDDCQWRHGECVEAGATDCGDHNAPSCSRCPYGKEGYHQDIDWCGGECRWNDNIECVPDPTTTAINTTNPSGYYLVTSGTACERITSRIECEEAARKLGLFYDTSAEGANTSIYWPPYCYYDLLEGLFFNVDGNSTSQCSASDRICICKKTSGKAGSQICNEL